MPISAVTHINHVADTPLPAGREPVLMSLEMERLAAAEVRPPPQNFVRNPKIVEEETVALTRDMEFARNALDKDGVLAEAETLKVQANKAFSEGLWRCALVGYAAGVWLLRAGRPACPTTVAHAVASAREQEAEHPFQRLVELAAWLRATALDRQGGEAEPLTPAAAALRTSFLLNAAMAALKLEEWASAKAACELVLTDDEGNRKALFRLAKAFEGEGELGRAVSALLTLVKADPKNGDARRLLDGLRARQAEERGKFKAMFGDELKPERPQIYW